MGVVDLDSNVDDSGCITRWILEACMGWRAPVAVLLFCLLTSTCFSGSVEYFYGGSILFWLMEYCHHGGWEWDGYLLWFDGYDSRV